MITTLSRSRVPMTGLFFLLAGFYMASTAWAEMGKEGMTQMPIATEKKTFTVKGDEDFESTRGFGEQEPTVRMMNLMMVEGSGMDGMKMDKGVKMASHAKSYGPGAKQEMSRSLESFVTQASVSPDPPKAGSNQIDFSIEDAKTHQPMKGLKLHAKVYMTSMDMGTTEPKVKEVKPGHYELNATFAMRGPWEVKIEGAPVSTSSSGTSPTYEQTFDFDAGSGKKWTQPGK